MASTIMEQRRFTRYRLQAGFTGITATTEDERVAPLEPDHTLALTGPVDQRAIDVLLGQAVIGASLATGMAGLSPIVGALLMAGADFQKELSHGVPQQPGAGGRISFTFRVHDKDKEEALYAAWLQRQPRGE